jgi:hypothetical protein
MQLCPSCFGDLHDIVAADLDRDDAPGSIWKLGQVLLREALSGSGGRLLMEQLAARVQDDVQHLEASEL